MSKLKISVITPAFNSASTIADTIESVLAQTYDDVEHVIVDGGSTDGTIDIVHRYEPAYHGRLRWVSEPDKGIYDAINKGIVMASGDVVGILNSDDFFTYKDILETVAQNISSLDAVYGDVHYVKNTDLSKCIRYYSSHIFKPGAVKMGLMPAHPSFYCKKNLYENLGLYDTEFKVAADFDLILRFIYLNKIRTKYIEQDFVTMRLGGASTSGLNSHLIILKEHKAIFRKHSIRFNLFLIALRYLYKLTESFGIWGGEKHLPL